MFSIVYPMFFSFLTQAEEPPWELLATEDGMTIEQRKSPQDSIIEVRVKGIIKAPIAAAMNVLQDDKRYPEWMKLSKEPKLVGYLHNDPQIRIFYNRASPAFIIKDRDYYVVVRVLCSRMFNYTEVNFSTSDELKYPEISGVIRINNLHGHWRFRSIDNGENTLGEYQLYIDMGGLLTKHLKNYAAKKLATSSFSEFRQQVLKTNDTRTEKLKAMFPQLFPYCIK